MALAVHPVHSRNADKAAHSDAHHASARSGAVGQHNESASVAPWLTRTDRAASRRIPPSRVPATWKSSTQHGTDVPVRRTLDAPSRLQAKLAIGPVGDTFEQEADRVAEQVMRTADPNLQVGFAPPQISRKCAECEEEEAGNGRIQKAPAELPAPSQADAPPTVYDVLDAPGQPLDHAARDFFEPRFGRDFSTVRVHTDAAAAASARQVNSLAYTVGNDIVFADQRYGPTTPTGQRLLAHELTHVVQQGAAPNAVSPARTATAARSAGATPTVAPRVQRQPATPLPVPEIVLEQVVIRGTVTVANDVVPAATAAVAAEAGVSLVALGLVAIGTLAMLGATYFVCKLIDEHHDLDEYGGTLPPGGLPEPKTLKGPVTIGGKEYGPGEFQPDPQGGAQPQPAPAPEPEPKKKEDCPQCKAVRFGTTADYGALDDFQRPRGIKALLKGMPDQGTEADQSIRPPGWTGGVVNQARAHLLAATLGGSGSEPRNLVTMDQGANLRMFHEFEGEAAEIAATNPTHCYAYTVTPEYLGTPGKAEDRSLMMPHRVTGNLVDLCTGEVEINQRHVDNLLPH